MPPADPSPNGGFLRVSQEGWCRLAKQTKKKPTKKTKKKAAKKTAKKSTKKVTKKVTKKPAKSSKKKITKKSTSKKPTKKVAKKTTKKTTKKIAKKTSKKKITKKAAPKTTKKVAKKTTKKVSKKTPSKSAASKKPAPKSKPAVKNSKPTASKAKETPTPADDAKKKMTKRPRARSRKKNPADYAPPPRPLLLGPGSKHSSGPLITSSKRPKKAKAETKKSRRTKTPFTPAQLDHYKLVLLQKRASLVGDVKHLEDEALRSNSGETQTASNAAEFGSESFEQGLNLELAAADRELIHQIDDALDRIADRTYGLCMESHQPIKKARLEELPWAKYSIETARKMDARHHR